MIAAMFLHRSRRSLVALLTVATLLFCHATAYAFGQLASAGGDVAIGDCHHGSEEGPGTPASRARTACDYAQSVGDAYKVGAAPMSAPVLHVGLATETTARVPDAPRPSLRIAYAGAPPPPRLLHCRFLN
jgi:hypothetical protein